MFRDGSGDLRAFEAHYDPDTGMISFASDISGEFVVVAFESDIELFSEAFYQALAELADIRLLFT